MKRLLITLTFGLMAGPALAVDVCLIGDWQADVNDLAQIMGRQMDGAARHVGGQVRMKISDNGDISMHADDLVINVAPNGIPAMDVTVMGSSRGKINAEDGSTFSANVTDYALTGAADVLGQRKEIPFSSANGMLGSASGTYTCMDDRTDFTPDAAGRMPERWQRLR